MRRRALGFVAAGLLAVVGAVGLLAWVNAAEERALEGEELADVYVVADPIPAGAPAEEIADRVRIEQLPAKVRVADAVVDLDELEGLVATVDLQAGEQITRSRFALVQSVSGFEGPSIPVPADHVEVTVQVDAQRAVGGTIVPGELITIFGSFGAVSFGEEGQGPVDYGAPALPEGRVANIEYYGRLVAAGDAGPTSTHVTLHNVLVTNVLIEATQAFSQTGEDEDLDGIIDAPTGDFLVTVALPPADAERFVWLAEFGSMWFGSEGDAVTDEDTNIQLPGTVYLDEYPEFAESIELDDFLDNSVLPAPGSGEGSGSE